MKFRVILARVLSRLIWETSSQVVTKGATYPAIFPGAGGSAAALARSAFSANTARACADNLVTAAYRTRDPHKDAAKRYDDPFGMTIAIPAPSRSGGIVRRMVCDHVDHFLFTGALQIRYGPV